MAAEPLWQKDSTSEEVQLVSPPHPITTIGRVSDTLDGKKMLRRLLVQKRATLTKSICKILRRERSTYEGTFTSPTFSEAVRNEPRAFLSPIARFAAGVNPVLPLREGAFLWKPQELPANRWPLLSVYHR
jgi:hypothetical protein